MATATAAVAAWSVVTTRVRSLNKFCGAVAVYYSSRQRRAGRTVVASTKKTDEPREDVDALASLGKDDSNYLWKLAAGSVGGASAIKYGSVLFPDVTRPNIAQALLMVSLPVLVAVLILLKKSYLEDPEQSP